MVNPSEPRREYVPGTQISDNCDGTYTICNPDGGERVATEHELAKPLTRKEALAHDKRYMRGVAGLIEHIDGNGSTREAQGNA